MEGPVDFFEDDDCSDGDVSVNEVIEYVEGCDRYDVTINLDGLMVEDISTMHTASTVIDDDNHLTFNKINQ